MLHTLPRVFQNSLSMATSVLLSTPAIDGRELTSPTGIPKSSFLSDAKLFFSPSLSATKLVRGRSFRSPTAVAKSFDHIPKQFREGNLADGLMDNFKNFPPSLYGLTRSQMDMFMTEDNPTGQVTEENISSAYHYGNEGMYSMSGMHDVSASRFSSSLSMIRGGRGRRPRRAPPDLPSYLLDGRIIYLGLPIVPAVTELIVAQYMWLDYDDPSKPIYLYINSTGIRDERKRIIGSDTDAFAIVDVMDHVKADTRTLNVSMAYGPAAMLLALGTKGHRHLCPHSLTILNLPHVYDSRGSSSDMWVKARELEANTDCTLNFLSRGIGKPKEEISKDIEGSRFFLTQDAIDYGIADKIVKPTDRTYENFSKRPPKKFIPRSAGSNPRAASAGVK